MKVICVENLVTYGFPKKFSLTINNSYDVIREQDNQYLIKNDKDDVGLYNVNRFMTIKEYRKLKLQSLNEIE
jgi:hypothetical protein